MSRPKKQVVDWFPHYAASGKTMFILESQYGNDGYALWFKTLELLASSEGHFLHLETPAEQAFLQAKTRLDWVIICRIYDLLAELGAITADLWHEQRIIWSDHFTDGIAAVYVNRKAETPSRPSFYSPKPRAGVVSTAQNPQRKEVEEGSRGSEGTPDAHLHELGKKTRKPEPDSTPGPFPESDRSPMPENFRDMIAEAARRVHKERYGESENG